MVDLLIVGSLTRDHTLVAGGADGEAGRGPSLRWTQPGGAAWHAGLALAGKADVAAVAQAGPWVRCHAVPGLSAAGVRWLGPVSAVDTVFRNRYQRGSRRQWLLCRAATVSCADLPDQTPRAASVSPLFAEDVEALVVSRLAAAGTFVGVDLQGALRRPGRNGQVETVRTDLGAWLGAAQVVKASEREFRVAIGGATDWQPAAAVLARRHGVELLITRGGKGAVLTTASETLEVASAAIVGDFDNTGAGDILLAAYVLARGEGSSPAGALDVATDAVQTVLRRRIVAPDRAPILHGLRRLHAVGLLAIRSRHDADVFAADSRLRLALDRHIPRSALADGGASPTSIEQRVGDTLSRCWALWTLGWPVDAALADILARC